MSTIKLAQSIKVSFASRLLKNYAEHQRHKKTLPVLLSALGLTGAGAAGKAIRDLVSDQALDNKSAWQHMVNKIDAQHADRVSKELAAKAAPFKLLAEHGVYPERVISSKAPSFAEMKNIFSNLSSEGVQKTLSNLSGLAHADSKLVRPNLPEYFRSTLPHDAIENAKDVIERQNLATINALSSLYRQYSPDVLDALGK